MRYSFTNLPVDDFVIPPGGPPAVQEAYAAYNALADQYRAALAEVEDLPDLEQAAVGAAHAAAAEARVNGVAPPKDTPDKVKASFAAKRAKAATNLHTAEIALDAAGDALVNMIADHQDEWSKTLACAEVKIAKKAQKAMDGMREALDELAAVRSAPAWVAAFNRGDALRSRLGNFAEATLNLQPVQDEHGIVTLDGSHLASELVDFLDVIVNPPAPRVPRPLTVARESSRSKLGGVL